MAHPLPPRSKIFVEEGIGLHVLVLVHKFKGPVCSKHNSQVHISTKRVCESMDKTCTSSF